MCFLFGQTSVSLEHEITQGIAFVVEAGGEGVRAIREGVVALVPG